MLEKLQSNKSSYLSGRKQWKFSIFPWKVTNRFPRYFRAATNNYFPSWSTCRLFFQRNDLLGFKTSENRENCHLIALNWLFLLTNSPKSKHFNFTIMENCKNHHIWQLELRNICFVFFSLTAKLWMSSWFSTNAFKCSSVIVTMGRGFRSPSFFFFFTTSPIICDVRCLLPDTHFSVFLQVWSADHCVVLICQNKTGCVMLLENAATNGLSFTTALPRWFWSPTAEISCSL